MNLSGMVGEKDILRMDGRESRGEAGAGDREVGEGVKKGILRLGLDNEEGIFLGYKMVSGV